MSTKPPSSVVRNALILFVLLGGAVLQYAYSSTSHPSVLLKAWALVFGILGVVAIVGLAFLGVQRSKDRRAPGR